MEMARRDGELVGGITAFADGPDEMREVIREHVELGVDNIKLSMSGEEVGGRLCTFHPNVPLTDPSDHRNSLCSRLLLHRRRDGRLCRRGS